MSFTKTVSEFSTSRKIKYGGGETKKTSSALSTVPSSHRAPLKCEQEPIGPHTAGYTKDASGNRVYVIEFNIGSFKFDELTIKTDSNRLFVKGCTKSIDDSEDEVKSDFKREFKLPKDCDETTIKAELDEKTRILRLTGQLAELSEKNAASIQQSSYSSFNSEKFNAESHQSFNMSQNIGDVREVKSTNLLEYEVYLGNELKDGEVIFEVPNKSTLNIRICKNRSDANGDMNLELKREIRLPMGAKLNNIDNGVDSRTKTLIIKVPLC